MDRCLSVLFVKISTVLLYQSNIMSDDNFAESPRYGSNEHKKSTIKQWLNPSCCLIANNGVSARNFGCGRLDDRTSRVRGGSCAPNPEIQTNSGPLRSRVCRVMLSMMKDGAVVVDTSNFGGTRVALLALPMFIQDHHSGRPRLSLPSTNFDLQISILAAELCEDFNRMRFSCHSRDTPAWRGTVVHSQGREAFMTARLSRSFVSTLRLLELHRQPRFASPLDLANGLMTKI